MSEVKNSENYLLEFFAIYDIKKTTPIEYFCWKYSKTKKLYSQTTLDAEKTDYITFVKDKFGDTKLVDHHRKSSFTKFAECIISSINETRQLTVTNFGNENNATVEQEIQQTKRNASLNILSREVSKSLWNIDSVFEEYEKFG
ncbi:17692_t:CDS:2, partial [Racocetra fulgida]